ncbi:DUF2785 domain-containing protein [Fusibacter sp. JL298sf-3]
MKQFDAIEIIKNRLIETHLVSAIYLKGSLARDEADMYSDVDLYCLILPEHVDAFLALRLEVLKAYKPMVYWSEANFVGPQIVCVYEDGLHLDLYVQTPETLTQTDAIKVLYDPENYLENYIAKPLDLSTSEMTRLFDAATFTLLEFETAYLRGDLVWASRLASHLSGDLSVLLRHLYHPEYAKLGCKRLNCYLENALSRRFEEAVNLSSPNHLPLGVQQMVTILDDIKEAFGGNLVFFDFMKDKISHLGVSAQESALKEALTTLPLDERDGADALQWVNRALPHVGSLDSTLRDELIYEQLCDTVFEGKLAFDDLRTIAHELLSTDYLFYDIEKGQGDAVFKRSFSALHLATIVGYHNENSFLTADEIEHHLTTALKYLKAEKDTRGYVEGKGWAHAIAHVSDWIKACLVTYNVRPELQRAVLTTVVDKMLDADTVYCHNEDMRMARVVKLLVEKGTLTEADFEAWVAEICTAHRAVGSEKAQLFVNRNRLNFLKALYFTLGDYYNHKAMLEACIVQN